MISSLHLSKYLLDNKPKQFIFVTGTITLTFIKSHVIYIIPIIYTPTFTFNLSAERSMNNPEIYEQWKTLYNLINTSPERYPVNDWVYFQEKDNGLFSKMDLWPIIKSQILLRLTNYFHTETGPAKVATSEKDRARPTTKFIHESATPVVNTPVNLSENHQKERLVSSDKLRKIGFGRMSRAFPKYHSDVLFLGAGMCNYETGSVQIQNHIDPLRLALEAKGVKTATALLDVSKDDPITRDAFLGGTYGFSEYFGQARYAYAKIPLFDFSQLPGFADWLDEINEVFPIEHIITREIISSAIAQTYSCYKVFRDYFRINNIKAVFIYCYYGYAGHAASLACRESGIPCVDIQHGVAGEGHESYSWPHSPVDGYNTLPTNFLTWTDEEAQSINVHKKGRFPTAVNIGHSWKLTDDILNNADEKHSLVNYNRFQETCKDYNILKNLSEEAFGNETTESKNILVCLYTNESTFWLEEVMQKAPLSWKFFLRLHPGEAKDKVAFAVRLSALKRLDIEVSLSTKLPIPALMPHMDVIVNKYSSVIHDARAYNVPSVCYSLSAKWYYNTKDNNGIKIVKHDAKSILAGIKSVIKKQEHLTKMPLFTQTQLSDLLTDLVNTNTN